MISLNDKFSRDIQQNNVIVYPIVIIDTEDENPIYISTVKEAISLSEGDSPIFFKDYDLRVSNVKESIAVDTHNFTISNVVLTLNNYEHNNQRLSDVFNDKINDNVDVYYKTQSCKYLSDCLLVHRGVIRRTTYDDNKIKITLEDLTDSKLHKDVPIANLGFGRNCLNKDLIDRHIPMTYGAVSKAPVLPYIDNAIGLGETVIYIIPDDVEGVTQSNRNISITGFDSRENIPENLVLKNDQSGDKNNPFYIYKDDYFRVLKWYDKKVEPANSEEWYNREEQYKIDGSNNFLVIEKIFTGGFPQNPPAANELQTVKVNYPNQTLILESEADTSDEGFESAVINFSPESGILRPEAAIDNDDNPTNFFNSGVSSSVAEFSTFAQVPNNQPSPDDDFDPETFKVNLFTPFTDVGFGIWNPSSPDGKSHSETTDGNRFSFGCTNYLWTIAAWLQVNAHLIDSVRYVNVPCGNRVVYEAVNYLKNNGFANILFGEGAGFVYPLAEAPEGQETKLVEIYPQYCISSAFRDAWVAASSLRGDETINMPDWSNITPIPSQQNIGNHEYFPSNIQHTLNTGRASFLTGIGFFTKEAYSNNEPILRGDLGNEGEGAPCHYPTTVYKMFLNKTHENNLQQLDFIYVGQYIPDSMPDVTSTSILEETDENGNPTKALWINMFYDERYDIPFLFDIDKLATFNPIDLKTKRWCAGAGTTPYDKFNMEVQFSAYWNGIPLGTYWDGSSQSAFGTTSSYINDSAYYAGTTDYDAEIGSEAAGYCAISQFENWGGKNIKMNEIFSHSQITQSNLGGKSWALYIKETIPSGNVLNNLAGAAGHDIGDEYFDNGCRTIINKGTLIPIAHKVKAYEGNVSWGFSGYNFAYDYAYEINKDNIVVTVGSDNVAEERLALLFPLSNLASIDAISGETNTFIYGGLSVNISDDLLGATLAHSLDSEDKFLVQAYATNTITNNDVTWNSEFIEAGDLAEDEIGADYGTNLIKIPGDNEIFGSNGGGQVSWSVWGSAEVDFTNNQFDGETTDGDTKSFTDYRINEWSNPDTFDALSLVYRVQGSDDITNYAQFNTDINSIGIIQFTVYEKALDSDLYADVIGRNEVVSEGETPKYTVGGGTIENPADVMFHFTEVELGLIDVMDFDSLALARQSNSDINFAFSVKEKINSKTLLEQMSTNTKLFPKFKSTGEFAFSLIKDVYGGTNITIKQSEVVSFSFERTKIEKIKTLVNVKYRKDYAEDKYTRETGWCDGYDFFGNGENNTQVIKSGGILSPGYDYNSMGLERENNIFEFESDYIRDHDSAVQLRDYIYMLNCNQHTIVKCTLPLKYMNLEVGDVIDFDSLNNGLKAYGEDYTSSDVYRNGQQIYPYFIITSTTKSSKEVKLEAMQLHRLQREFTPGIGSVSRKSEVGLSFFFTTYEPGTEFDPNILGEIIANGYITMEDEAIINNIIMGQEKYLTTNQKVVADITGDGNIDQLDLTIIQSILSYPDTIVLGDVNGDGELNVADLNSLIYWIMGDWEFLSDPTWSQLLAADFDQNGIVDVADIVAMIGAILAMED